MSGLQHSVETEVAGVDVQERGNSLRVATNTPHLVSLGCGRLSTAVTIHPIKQGRVTIGSEGSSDIRIQGTGVQVSHCHIENSHGVVTLYPLSGDTTVDGVLVDKPIRLSQGCTIGIGRSNYLRFNHPAEANLMKSVLPNSRISMAPIHFLPNEGYQSSQSSEARSQESRQQEYHRVKEEYSKTNGGNEMDQANYESRYSNESSSNEQGTNHNLFMDGHRNLEKELDMTYKELSKRKPPAVPRKMFKEFDQISNSSNSDQECSGNAKSTTPPKVGGIMSKVSKFEYYVRNSQKNTKTPKNPSQNMDYSPKVFSSNSLTVNTPAKDVLVNKDVPTNFQQKTETNTLNNVNDLRGQRRIVLNENNAVEAKNCSYTNVTVKNQVIKIDQMARSYQGVLSKTQNVDRNRSVSPDNRYVYQQQSQGEESYNEQSAKSAIKIQTPSASFNRNPVFNNPTATSPGVATTLSTSPPSEAEIRRQQAQLGRMEDESQKVLEEARLEEILNMCAEYEKQISLGVPTTPTEKKQHSKIITNGSLPRGVHNNPNIVQTSDGYFRFDTTYNRSDYSPLRVQPPSPVAAPQQPNFSNRSQPIPLSRSQPNSKNLSNYENVQVFAQSGPISPNGQVMNMMQQNIFNYASNDGRNQHFPSHHSSYENFSVDGQNVSIQRQENYVQNVRQFPITELSSPIMIRKIARNAQNSSNYVGSYERTLINNGDHLSPPNPTRPGNFVSPYENVMMKNNVLSIGNVPYAGSMPRSPSAHSPRTRIKTTYAHKNVISPQHFVFPSSTIAEQDSNERDENSHRERVNGEKCQGIEKQLSLTEDIPMIDDTEFANELEMRIARLKPENRKIDEEEENLLDPDNIFGGQSRNFEEIKRDLMADIPELDEIHRHIDRDLSESMSRNDKNRNDSLSNALKKISEEMMDDEVFEEPSDKTFSEAIESPTFMGQIVNEKDTQQPNEVFVMNTIIEERLHQEKSSETMSRIEEESPVVQIVQRVVEEVKVEMLPQREELTAKDIVNISEEFITQEREKIVKENTVLTKERQDNDEETENRVKQIEDDIRMFVSQAEDRSFLDGVEEPVEDASTQLEILRCKRKEVLTEIHKVKCKMADIRAQEDDILRELEMEKALLQGEYDSELAILKLEQGRLVFLQEKVRSAEAEAHHRRETQEQRQAAHREKVDFAAHTVHRLEKEFAKHEATLEELRNAQETLETERKAFEDMEFQDLEEEADWLAYREELQNDISSLTQKTDAQKSRILNLRFETSNNLSMAKEETKSLQRECVKMLNKKEELTNKLQTIEEEIKSTVLEIGTEYKVDRRNSSMEEKRSRIKSGDFSPPSSDNEDFNNAECLETRRRNLNERLVSMDQMSQSMIVDLGDKRSIDDLIDKDRSLRSTEASPNKVIDCNSNESSPSRAERSVSSDRSKTDLDLSPDCTKEKKQGFWERNFDSLSRLKGKDKKNKQKSQDIMSQSLNENMFFNNENIESEYGSFEKCNSLRNSKKNKSKNTDSSNTDKTSKLSFSSLGKMMRKDSLKKQKEDKSNRNSVEIANKENIDTGPMSETVEDKLDSEQKSVKHRYVKNAKCGNTDNKYLSKCTKTTQQPISISPETNNTNYNENSYRLSNNSYGDNRESYTDSLEEEVRIIDPQSGNTIQLCEVTKNVKTSPKPMFRKSAGDEIRRYSGEFLASLGENTKVPSQDDIDRISKVTLDAPLLSKNGDMNSLGRRTLDSLREVERNRVAMLEQKGCQVMDLEREKISELKKRVQNEARQQWEENQLLLRGSTPLPSPEVSPAKLSLDAAAPVNIDNESIPVVIEEAPSESSSPEKQLRHSQTESYNSSAFIEDEESGVGTGLQRDGEGIGDGIEAAEGQHRQELRPISQLSDMSSENGGLSYSGVEAPRRSRRGMAITPKIREDLQRPLTRYLPIDQDDLNLRAHIESAGHQVDLCPHVMIDSTSCRGYLHKLGAKFHTWSKRWFVFERSNKTLIYYSDKSEKKPRGGAYFQVIEEVYLDHLNVSKSPTPLTTFVIKTRQRRYYLMAPSGQAARIWIDVIFTGAQGYTEYM